MTPDEMRRAAVLLSDTTDPECDDLARLLREEADSQGWRDIATAPTSDVVLLLVEDTDEQRVFAAEHSIDGETGVWYWCVTHGWTGWTRLHSCWTPIGWRPLPPPPQGREG